MLVTYNGIVCGSEEECLWLCVTAQKTLQMCDKSQKSTCGTIMYMKFEKGYIKSMDWKLQQQLLLFKQ